MSTSTKTEDFTATLSLPASPDAIAALFASSEGVSRWWGATQGDAQVGGTLVTAFGEHGVNAVRVLEAGPTRVVWESIGADGGKGTTHEQEWMGTTLEFDIAPAAVGTDLRFRHAGLTPQLACWEDCFAGWTHFMASIQAYAETGTGHPFPA